MKQVNNICPQDVQLVVNIPKEQVIIMMGQTVLCKNKLFFCRRQKEDNNLFPQVFILREQITSLKEKVILTEQVINLF